MAATLYADASTSFAGLDFSGVRTRGSIPWVVRLYFLALEVIFAPSELWRRNVMPHEARFNRLCAGYRVTFQVLTFDINAQPPAPGIFKLGTGVLRAR